MRLKSGCYTRTANVRNSYFTKLALYATANGRTFTYPISKENADWLTSRLKSIATKDGRVEIGFLAEGTPASFCYVDDRALVKDR